MGLVNGFNHVATLTADLDRLSAFYRDVFDAQTVYQSKIPGGPGYRHALIELSPTCALHVFEVPENQIDVVPNEIFARGRVDHIALSVPDEETLEVVLERLVARDASPGTVTRFGSVVSVFFVDPDGMQCEVATLEAGKSFADSGYPPPDDVFWERTGLRPPGD